MPKQPSTAARERVRSTVPKLVEATEQWLYGDIWERPQLSKRDRSLITCAVLVATYRPEQLRGHLQRALAAVLILTPAGSGEADVAGERVRRLAAGLAGGAE